MTNIPNGSIGSYDSEITRSGFARLHLPDIPLDQPRGADASTSPRDNDPDSLGKDGQVGAADARSEIVESNESEGVSSYLGDSGYITMFVRGNTSRSSESSVPSRLQEPARPLPTAVRDYHLQVFDEYCFTFCPILDRTILEDQAFGQSVLLEKALTLVSRRIQPSLLDGDNAAILYNQSKDLFYKFSEPSPTASLISIMLFYWWSTCSPSMLSTNGTWYWTGIAIRQAQEMGLHRLPRTYHCLSSGDTPALRRRIWWTLFARERLTSLSQGRPCTINIKDCNVQKPTITDWPSSKRREAEIFIQWVKLCEIVGHVAKHLRRHPEAKDRARDLLDDLKVWIANLPQDLRLPYFEGSLSNFDRDICQLHLPYLCCLILLDLRKSSQQDLGVDIVAILASSCVARIFEDLLIRGSLRFLQGMAGWYITISLLALIRATEIPAFASTTDGPIRVLRVALKDMAERWPSAKMFHHGIEHLMSSPCGDRPDGRTRQTEDQDTQELRQLEKLDSFRYQGQSHVDPNTLTATAVQNSLNFFPGANPETTPFFKELLSLTDPLGLPLTSDEFNQALFDLFENSFDSIPIDFR
ncbi:hypothetical protein N7474_010468 [Penicillium riverlandense]|uniref:uncharacterized protein n=1 Tax=Penicillium riverlandense TaxID=1903569 RepID=UPI002547A632|nr:uncharacterized protein N7474_010468 [Penicillium riverlandense]KAJ5806876.1 hypothetical protein N7474_010468 [Penicillium riverlandense]